MKKFYYKWLFAKKLNASVQWNKALGCYDVAYKGTAMKVAYSPSEMTDISVYIKQKGFKWLGV